jgi:arylsulfatase A-like enzyme
MPQPNLIFLMPDQLRADYLSCYGAPFIHTPNIDRLAQDGVIFQNAYSPSPICVPARASLIMGMDALRTGVLDNGQFVRPDYAQMGLNTWPELLGQNGYRTAAIGKMHFYPWEIHMGFDDRVIAEDKVWILIEDDYQRFLKQHGYAKTMHIDRADYHEHHQAIIHSIPWEYSVDHFVGQETCRYIREYDDARPFAMMVGFPGPHFPYDPNEKFAREFDPAAMPDSIPEVPEDTLLIRGDSKRPRRRLWCDVYNPVFTEAHKKRIRAYYCALIKQIDYEVGCILKTLEERNLLENTVIILSSDHGDYLGDHGLMGKSIFFDQAARVPMIVRQPGAEVRGVSDELVALTDVTATLLNLGGCPIPTYMDARPMPGLGLPEAPPREEIICMLSIGTAIVTDHWKLCKYAFGGTLLFDRQTDPQEQHNLARDPQYLPVLLELEARLNRAVMRSVNLAHGDKRVYTTSLSSDVSFGQEGWQRTYPQCVERDSPIDG